MQTIYIMDTEMPISKNNTNVYTLEDVKEKDDFEIEL